MQPVPTDNRPPCDPELYPHCTDKDPAVGELRHGPPGGSTFTRTRERRPQDGAGCRSGTNWRGQSGMQASCKAAGPRDSLLALGGVSARVGGKERGQWPGNVNSVTREERNTK